MVLKNFAKNIQGVAPSVVPRANAQGAKDV